MNKIDKVKLAIYNIATPTPQKVAKAKWVVYGATALCTILMFAVDGGSTNNPKIPRNLGD